MVRHVSTPTSLRQLDETGGSFSKFALQPNTSPMEFRYVFGQRKPQTKPFMGACDVLLHLIEALENVLQFICSNTRPIIRNGYLAFFSFIIDLNRNLSTLLSKYNGIFDNIKNKIFEHCRTANDNRAFCFFFQFQTYPIFFTQIL